NDARPNHLLVHFNSPAVRNIAVLAGNAYGFRGYSNACMGIATGDFDRNGHFDLHITNFDNEPNNLFLQSKGGIFSDYATRYQLNALSEPYVGFGIKAVDFHWNGWLDFFVTNGHVFDQRSGGKDFQMPPQFLFNQADRFLPLRVNDRSNYCQGSYVGRAVAKIDFDRDLDFDFLVGHLDAPAALLANQTERPGHGLQLVLVGTESERDAIGTRVVVSAGGKQWTDWVTAGDGYLSCDQAVLDFGVGQADEIDSIEVHWISGRQQVFEGATTDRRYLLVEGSDDLWMLEK
ncbi:MAG: ASPIC/UnbV domain-containing protein, partial [Pirellulales bacterium]|nr:ASPIC/UnbV domain-containing protein [Pirellulales bacterium]